MVQSLSEIKSLLDVHGLSPKKKFGQNFLHDHNHLERIIDAAEIGTESRGGGVILEVGPGTGALTEFLLETGANVVAVEIDKDMRPILEERLGKYGERFRLYVGSVLASKHVLAPEVSELIAGRGFKLIANLPYNVASPLLVNLAQQMPNMQAAVVMVQKEVADRLAAGPGSKDYGPLGIVIQALYEARHVSTLPPSCFWPAPKIASAVVQLTRREKPLTDDLERFSDLVHKLFQKRRKQIGSVLGRDLAYPEGISPEVRPEQLSLVQLEALSKMVAEVT
ncbi:16S rRNA (adenine(1518)-N(6)/adenine(1519)-N(6))-dimethyltransferase RsmA [Poriferisphaera sp. WC338]|uniref:16S rRNA (adenine(1518)-N(6)/adenine(1519)-N(6))- dimethyltransferase RsmA n=1 Tax=Poriferisphaera sp. WC338 TaxID=3425129 RepID=UPI003D814DC5